MITYLEENTTGNEFTVPVCNTSLQHLAQTQFAHLEEVVRNFYDIIPRNLVKYGAKNNEISFVMIL